MPPFVDPFQELVNSTVHSFSQSAIYETPYNVPLQLHDSILDTIINLFFHRFPPVIFRYFLYLFNSSYFHGVVPQFWKTAIVCPIPKPGKNPKSVLGYRPISLLSCVGKVMERVIKVRLEHFLATRQVFL